jgi:hypothetical protein
LGVLDCPVKPGNDTGTLAENGNVLAAAMLHEFGGTINLGGAKRSAR